jgi:hypothetical protein
MSIDKPIHDITVIDKLIGACDSTAVSYVRTTASYTSKII